MPMKKTSVQPRILRANQAPAYLGMCLDEFNKTVRPNVHEFPIGKQGVGFHRLELDEWADNYIATHSIDTRVSSDTPARQKREALQPERKERRRTITVLGSKISDP